MSVFGPSIGTLNRMFSECFGPLDDPHENPVLELKPDPVIRSSGRTCIGMPRGLFVVLEGINCAGKSSLVRPVAELLSEVTGFDTKLHADPYSAPDTTVKEALIKLRAQPDADPEELGYLYTLNRKHLWDRIEWDLTDGFNVVCDRWSPSTWVFQGQGSPVLWENLTTFSNRLQIGVADLYIFLSLEWSQFVARRLQRAKAGQIRRMDNIGEARFQKLCDLYAQFQGDAIHQIDTHYGLEDTQRDLLLQLHRTLPGIIEGLWSKGHSEPRASA